MDQAVEALQNDLQTHLKHTGTAFPAAGVGEGGGFCRDSKCSFKILEWLNFIPALPQIPSLV